MIEGKVPPPFGLITPDALSPCLFTLLQQLGHEGVNKASSPSTAWIKTSVRKLRSLSGPCQTLLCATTQLQTGGFGSSNKAHTALECKRWRAAVKRDRIDQAKQYCNKQIGAITAKVIRLTWRKSGERHWWLSKCALFTHTPTLILGDSYIKPTETLN